MEGEPTSTALLETEFAELNAAVSPAGALAEPFSPVGAKGIGEAAHGAGVKRHGLKPG